MIFLKQNILIFKKIKTSEKRTKLSAFFESVGTEETCVNFNIEQTDKKKEMLQNPVAVRVYDEKIPGKLYAF